MRVSFRIKPGISRRSSWRCAVAAATVLSLLAIGVSRAQPSPGAAPIPPGQARVWFYRVFFPEDTGGMPAVSMNGNVIGYARAGYTFYRDIPAGPYHVTVDTVGVEDNPMKDIVLTPGAQAYLAIQSDPTWISDRRGFRRPTYAVDVEPSHIAAIHMSQMQMGSGY